MHSQAILAVVFAAIASVHGLPQAVCSATYKVVSGDTCNSIGAKFGVSSQAIISANPSVNAACTNLFIGEALCIPATCLKYTVVAGDTCNSIGAKFGVSGQTIITANPAVNAACTNLEIGEILCIPL